MLLYYCIYCTAVVYPPPVARCPFLFPFFVSFHFISFHFVSFRFASGTCSESIDAGRFFFKNADSPRTTCHEAISDLINSKDRKTVSLSFFICVAVVVVFTLKAVPISTQYFLTSVQVQLTRTPSVLHIVKKKSKGIKRTQKSQHTRDNWKTKQNKKN